MGWNYLSIPMAAWFRWRSRRLLWMTSSSHPMIVTPLWRHNMRNGVPNHPSHDCFFNRLFRRRSKKKSKLRVTGLCEGNSPMTGEFAAQRAIKAENVSIRWRHHESNAPESGRTVVWCLLSLWRSICPSIRFLICIYIYIYICTYRYIGSCIPSLLTPLWAVLCCYTCCYHDS